MVIESLKKRIACPICCAKMEKHFTAQILRKYTILYYRCIECGLMQTEKPYWLDEAYDAAIADLDVGLVQRNIQLSALVSRVLDDYFDPIGKYLDFAGGYGLFVRMMRDRGFDFYRYDKFCDNIFAQYFDIVSLHEKKTYFELVTAFEFLEHIDDPLLELERIFEMTDTILLTTELLPPNITSAEDWWYFVPETGQHITFYSEKSFHKLAYKLGVTYYSDGKNHHLLTRRKIDNFSFFTPININLIGKIRNKLSGIFALPVKKRLRNDNISIIKDYEYIQKVIREQFSQ